MNLRFEKMNEQNFDKIVKIKRQLFPESSSEEDYEYAKRKPEFAEYFLFYCNDIPCAITGWYDFDETKTDAFMGWFGVLPEFRRKGVGKKVFETTLAFVKEKNYKYFRLYTDVVVNAPSVLFYTSLGMLMEHYTADDLLGKNGNFVVFTLPLSDEMEMWNNRPLNEDENYSDI